MKTEQLLELRALSVSYGGTEILHGIDLCLNRGEILAIVGESGSGKSTLLKAVQGLLGRNGTLTSGQILYQGRDITHLSPGEHQRMAGTEMAMIFQDPGASFCPVRTVGEQIFESVREHMPWDRKVFHEKAAALLKELQLPETVLDAYPFQLSGGMGQRVGILAAMILQPSILFADEPTSSLDTVTQKKVVGEFQRLRKQQGISMLIVTHHLGVAWCLADHIMILKEGRCVEYGSREHIFRESKEPYTKELLASVPRIS